MLVNFFNGSIHKKIASYSYHAAGICKMKPCPDPGEGRWRQSSGPGSFCLRGPCWLQWRLRQLKEVWKGAERRAWALHVRAVPIVRKRHQELPEWLRFNLGRNATAGERQKGRWELSCAPGMNPSQLCCRMRNPSFTVTLRWVTAQEQQTTPWGEESAVPRACEASTCLLMSAALRADLWRLQPFSKHCKLLEILVPKSLQSESKEDRNSSKETRTREM